MGRGGEGRVEGGKARLLQSAPISPRWHRRNLPNLHARTHARTRTHTVHNRVRPQPDDLPLNSKSLTTGTFQEVADTYSTSTKTPKIASNLNEKQSAYSFGTGRFEDGHSLRWVLVLNWLG